jgi:hypothetical protein
MKRLSEADLLKDLKRRHEALKRIKQAYESNIDELIKYCNHTRQQITDTTKSRDTGTEVFDGTANSANKIMADGLFGNLCSQSLRWFATILPVKMNWPRSSRNMRQWDGKQLDQVPEIKRWLEDTDDLLYGSFLGSNFYDEMPTFFRDGGSVACANMYVEYDIPDGKQVFTVLHPREYVVGLDKYGNVDTEFRTYKLTIRNLVKKFGIKVLSEDIQNIDQVLENSPYEERDVVHAVLPRDDYDPEMRDNKNKKWGSYWYLESGRKLLLESGYDYFQFIHWQYNRGYDGYGYGPGHEALTEIKRMQQQEIANLIAGQKMVEPPMVVHNNLRGLVQIGPKGKTYVNDMKMRPEPLMENIKLVYGLDMLDRTRKIVQEKWHVDFFMMLSQAAFNKLDITATQVMEMVSEKATMLGTVVGRIATDVLNPIIDLMYYAERDAGRLPQIPQLMLDTGLTNVATRIDYTGPLAQAQKRAHSTQGIRNGLTFIGEVSRIYPKAVNKVKWNNTLEKGLTDLGFPASCMETEADFAATNEAQTKQASDAAQLSQMAEMSKALPGLGKAVEANSPAEMMLNAAGGKLKPEGMTETEGGA